MAQTEEMKRLLRKGNIVGFKWDLLYEEAIKHVTDYDRYCYPERWYGKIIPLYSTDMKRWVMVEKIEYDSFELGIKYKDYWWFEGDMRQSGDVLCYGEYIPNEGGYGFGWYFKNKTGWIVPVDMNLFPLCDNIGNIHEPGTD